MKLLLIGLGNLGSQVLDLFLQTTVKHTILVAGRDLQYIQQRSNLSRFAAEQLGFCPDVSCTYMDLWNLNQTADVISKFKPDVIFSAVALQPWMTIAKLPHEIFHRLYLAQAGPWLPMTLAPMYKLMQAIKQTGLNINVINASYPDTVNAVLSKVGLAPLTGIGNLANNIPAIRHSIAFKLNRPFKDIEVRFFAHHYVSHHISRYGHAGGAPFHLNALIQGEDITHHLDLDTIFDLLPTRFKRAGGQWQLLTAASTIQFIHELQHHTTTILHVPGPNGLPGGYPIHVQKSQIEIMLPALLTLEKAIHINEVGQRLDGIERIDSDGTVYFTESNMVILKDTFGYECNRMALSDVEQWAVELKAKYHELASRAV